MSTHVLIVVRHAHRDTDQGRERDNGLSNKGRLQAKRLSDFLIQYQLVHAPDRLLSSPSLRCTETLNHLAQRYEKAIERLDVLGEQVKDESEKAFDRRIKGFIDTWRELPPGITIVCSHGDVIPAMLAQLVGLELNLKKGGFAELEVEDGRIKLRTVLQQLDFMPDT